ncbi:MAG: M56 family metallopeptidase [Clostridia bacterium]|nr:M56 family metallopeptidase [Clostridia bacterium]
MSGLFLKLVNMSISASWLIFAVLLLRVFLKKVPKWATCTLWGIVGLRLILPFSLESVLSLIPSAETISKELTAPRPTVEFGFEVVDRPINEYIVSHYYEGVTRNTGHFFDTTTFLGNIWLLGVVILLVYAVVSYIRLKNKLSTAVLLRDNIYQSENASSPFVLGIFSPKIYLPFNLSEETLTHVVAHENAHLKRNDHIWKSLGFLVLAIHWFNPLVLVGFVLFCKDIEIACDERVIKNLDCESKADYTQALLSCSVSRRIISACPLAFGEVGVKERVKSVLNYKKPAFWAILLAVIICVAVAVFFLTDPIEREFPVDAESRPLKELKENYSISQAIDDGCVVVKDSNLIAGEDVWAKFISKTEAKEPAVVRIYKYYSSSYNYYVKEISFNGKKFNLKYYDHTGDTHEEIFIDKEYKYLVYSLYLMKNNVSDHYFLSDSLDVTADGFWGSMVSSVYRPEYDIYNHCKLIFNATRKLSSLSSSDLEEFLSLNGVTLPVDGIPINHLVSDLEEDPNKVFVLSWDIANEFTEKLRAVVKKYYGID